MKMVTILASLALASLCFQAIAGERRVCTTSTVLKLSAGCLKTMSQNYSPKELGINYCPIPKEKVIPTS